MQDTILGWFFIISQKWRDRSPQAMLEHVNTLTGLPERADDLVPKHRAVQGAQLALMVTPTPSGLAESMLRYHADASVKCTETATCDGCRQLDQKPKAQWDEEEAAAVSELTYLIKRAVHGLAKLGYADPQPPDADGKPMPLGEDGMTMRFALTPAGLERARNHPKRDEWLSQVRGWEQALTKAEFNKAPEWLKAGA
jgi:hypothetical protein